MHDGMPYDPIQVIIRPASSLAQDMDSGKVRRAKTRVLRPVQRRQLTHHYTLYIGMVMVMIKPTRHRA